MPNCHLKSCLHLFFYQNVRIPISSKSHHLLILTNALEHFDNVMSEKSQHCFKLHSLSIERLNVFLYVYSSCLLLC